MTLILVDQPQLFLVVTLAIMWFAALGGRYIRKRRGSMTDDEREELNLVLTSALTLLALIIGFSFSMAVGRYDDRKRAEATEANTIATEYLRADLLPKSDETHIRSQLQQYVNERISTYEAGTNSVLLEHRSASKAIQFDMWSTVQRVTDRRPNAVTALAVSGMNEVIDAQRYAAASWDNRIPVEAWILMFAIALCCCALIGYDTKLSMGGVSGHFILPILIAISFYLIADLDSTHHGWIRVAPDNLITTAREIAPAK